MAFPGYAIDHYDSLKTSQQYMRSYNPINNRMVDEQFAFFDRMLDLTAKHGVDLLVVNMPLSRSNKAIIPPGFYPAYLNRLKDACARRNIQFVDYNSADWDGESNFIDTVHIRPEKSIAFVESLMKSVADSPLSLALSGAPNQQIGCPTGFAAPIEILFLISAKRLFCREYFLVETGLYFREVNQSCFFPDCS